MRIALGRKDATLMGYAYHQICAHAHGTYSFQKAMFAGQKALYYYRRSDIGVRGVQNLLQTLAAVSARRNDLEGARRYASQCEAVPEGDPFQCAMAWAGYHLACGDYGKALEKIDGVIAGLPEDLRGSLLSSLDFKMLTLMELCDFEGVADVAQRLLALGPRSESVLSEANAMLALARHRAGERAASRDSFVQAEFYSGQVKNDFDRVEALRDLALCRYLSGEPRKAEEAALEALVLGLRHSCYAPTFSLLVLVAESSAARGKPERARFFLNEASYFFTTGFLLPPKDLILYYYLASKLLDPSSSSRNLTVACRLLEEEKSRIGRAELVRAFLSLRSFGKVQEALDGGSGAIRGEALETAR
jgi:tetratricopeptide (TPR) repeat protein